MRTKKIKGKAGKLPAKSVDTGSKPVSKIIIKKKSVAIDCVETGFKPVSKPTVKKKGKAGKLPTKPKAKK